MYKITLDTHNILGIISFAFFVLLFVYILILFFSNKKISKAKILSKIIMYLFHLQLLIGIILYFVSPIVDSFLKNTSKMIKDTFTRFSSIEHPVMMILLVILVTLMNKSISKNKNKPTLIYLLISVGIIMYAFPFERVF